jgi:transposase
MESVVAGLGAPVQPAQLLRPPEVALGGAWNRKVGKSRSCPRWKGRRDVSKQTAMYVGIDVGKSRFDVTFGVGGRVEAFDTGDEGIAQLVARLSKEQVALIVLEASGGYERQLLASLMGAHLPAVAVNPRQVRDFAKAMGKLEKGDKVDSGVLAVFAERMKPEVRPPLDPALEEVKQWLDRRRQLVEMLVAEKNRTHQARGGVRRDINAHIDWLKKRLRGMEKELSDMMKNCSAWDAKVQLVDEQRGLGRLSSMSLVASLPELGTLTRRKISKLVGVAPLSNDSGKHRGRRTTWGGRAAVRATLYMVTLTAIRCNPTIRAFYKRLVARGKLKMVALVACMRKLLTILNAIVRDAQSPVTLP